MNLSKTINLGNLQATQGFAHEFLASLSFPVIVCLNGEIGVGKTTFTRYLLQKFDPNYHFSSPTFVFFKKYNLNNKVVIHLDCYRLLKDDKETILMLQELFTSDYYLLIVEWANKLPLNFMSKSNLNIKRLDFAYTKKYDYRTVTVNTG